MANVDDFFVEWRKSPNKHRESDVMISPEDVGMTRCAIEAALRWEKDVELKKTDAIGDNSPLLELMPSKKGIEEAIKEGQKFVVNPDYKGEPMTIESVRGKGIEDMSNVKIEFHNPARIHATARSIVETLDTLVKWSEIREEIKTTKGMSKLLFTFPKSEFPAFESFGIDSRITFWRKLCFELGSFTSNGNRLGKQAYDDLQPRIKDDVIEFWGFEDM